jgi:4-aminobutyrate aminotransferase-like enzyme
VTAASLAVLQLMLDEDIPEKCNRSGSYFREKLLQLKEKHSVIEDVRGVGLLLGMKLVEEGEPIVLECLQKGFIINCVQGDVLRFVPPLIVTQAEIDRLIDCLDNVFRDRVEGSN